MESGRLGVVVDQSNGSLLTPKVRLFVSTKSQLRIPPTVVDLSRRGVSDRIAGREDPARWNFPDLDQLWEAQ
jgi:hypothetical protein